MSLLTTVKISKPIELVRVKNLLCSAFEGGSGYWCRIDGYKFPKGISLQDFRSPGGKFQDPHNYFHPSQLVPLQSRCALKLYVDELEDGVKEWTVPQLNKNEKGDRFLLTRKKIIRGIQVFAEVFPRHFNDWIEENYDATTGDLFLQSCVLTEQVLKRKDAIFG